MDEGEGEVLVEEVAQKLTHAQIGPAAMDQQETLEVTELSEGEVTGENRLHALLPTNANADMGSCRGHEELKDWIHFKVGKRF